MPTVIWELLEEPVLQAWGLNVTPLQYASIHHLHPLVERLLTHGANGHAEHPRSDMPGWSLAKGVAAAQTSKEEGWRPEKVERYVWKEWFHSSQAPSETPSGQRLPARLWFFGMWNMGGQEFRKQNILALLRGQQLEEALPSAAPSRKGPRF